jgi:hypothetical protein
MDAFVAVLADGNCVYPHEHLYETMSTQPENRQGGVWDPDELRSALRKMETYRHFFDENPELFFARVQIWSKNVPDVRTKFYLWREIYLDASESIRASEKLHTDGERKRVEYLHKIFEDVPPAPSPVPPTPSPMSPAPSAKGATRTFTPITVTASTGKPPKVRMWSPDDLEVFVQLLVEVTMDLQTKGTSSLVQDLAVRLNRSEMSLLGKVQDIRARYEKRTASQRAAGTWSAKRASSWTFLMKDCMYHRDSQRHLRQDFGRPQNLHGWCVESVVRVQPSKSLAVDFSILFCRLVGHGGSVFAGHFRAERYSEPSDEENESEKGPTRAAAASANGDATPVVVSVVYTGVAWWDDGDSSDHDTQDHRLSSASKAADPSCHQVCQLDDQFDHDRLDQQQAAACADSVENADTNILGVCARLRRNDQVDRVANTRTVPDDADGTARVQQGTSSRVLRASGRRVRGQPRLGCCVFQWRTHSSAL